MRYLLDSGPANDYMSRRNRVHARAVAAVARGDQVGTCLPVVGELYYGAAYSADPARSWQRVQIALRTWTLWPFTLDAAAEYGRLKALLRRTGRPMQDIDIQLAAVALTLGNCTVVTTDGDLSAIPGLAVED